MDHYFPNPGAAGSNPAGRTKFFSKLGELACLMMWLKSPKYCRFTLLQQWKLNYSAFQKGQKGFYFLSSLRQR